jgi:hypothetical protein
MDEIELAFLKKAVLHLEETKFGLSSTFFESGEWLVQMATVQLWLCRLQLKIGR